jgi:hypothetical protein
MLAGPLSFIARPVAVSNQSLQEHKKTRTSFLKKEAKNFCPFAAAHAGSRVGEAAGFSA